MSFDFDPFEYAPPSLTVYKMLIKYTYPVTSSLFLEEHWPISVGPYKFEWIASAGRVEAITVTVRRSANIAELPTVMPNPQQGVAAAIDIGTPPMREEVDQAVRTLRGLLGFFSHIDINFEHPKIDWLAESEEEKALLKLHSFSVTTQKADLSKPHRLPFEFVARSILSTEIAAHYEIPMSFLRKADRDMHSSRHIEAFYSVFFFLETLFAPGYSSPTKVKQKFRAAKPIKDGIAEARHLAAAGPHRPSPRLNALLTKSDDEIIDHLVDLRGTLHHHALPRKSGTWHPEKQSHFEDDSWFIRHIAQKIAMDEILPILYAPERGVDAFRMAEEVGAVQTIRIEATGFQDGQSIPLPDVRIRAAGSKVSHETVVAADREFRTRVRTMFPMAEITEYRLISEDGTNVYAHYRRQQG